MADINTKLYDTAVDHLADTRRYEEKIKTLVERAVRRHQSRTRDELTKNIKADLTREITRSSVELNSLVQTAVNDYADAATTFYSNLLEKEAGSFYKVQKPNPTSVIPKTIGPKNERKISIDNRINGIANFELARVNSKIKAGLADGKSNKEIINEVLQTTRMTEAQVKSLIRTSITETQNAAIDAVLKENKELIKGVRFTAVLDNRTSKICGSLDGIVYPMDKILNRPPLHWNCRSSLVPVLKSKDELIKEYEKDPGPSRIKIDKLNSVAPDKLIGKAPPVESYSGWLRRQPMNVQLKQLGDEERVSLFQQGKLQLEAFITSARNAVDIQVLRRLDNARTWFFRSRQQALDVAEKEGIQLTVSTPNNLLKSTEAQKQLKALYLADAETANQTLSLVDYRGTSLPGKRVSRLRSNNEFDERNNTFDPITGEQRSTLLYDPDFNVYQERIDFLNNSKTLSKDQKQFIVNFVESLEDQVGVNQQSAILENLRVIFERYAKDKKPWDNFMNVIRAEMQFSVINTSRILDRRSRARSEQFGGLGVAGEPAKVQILGEYKTFEELTDSVLENQRFVQAWESKYATPIAQNILFRGRNPLYTFFNSPIGVKKFSFKKALEDYAKKNIPGAKAWIERNNPSEPMLQRYIREAKEELRKIIDLEFLFRRNQTSYLDNVLNSALGRDMAVKAINRATKTIASGQSTDYDTLAINIGKSLREEWQIAGKDVIPFFTNTLQDYHSDGSKILTAFKDMGYIRVAPRGKTRRSVIDIDTGRSSGEWKDTISREVQIIDKNMLELQRANRAILIAQRIGIVNDRDRLFVRPNEKTYFDARGRNTGIPIITRRANANYDKVLIDNDFADMLNHTMSVKYTVDPEFSSFMDDVVRFRDPAGNLQKYDELNGFRKLILTRGEQGYSFMQTVKFHRENNKPFSVIANIDGRGRVYYQGFLTPTGGAVVRPFMNTARSYNMTPEALKELMVQLGVLVADTTEGLSTAGRTAAFMRNEKAFREIGELLLATTQRDRRIREFLEHPLVRGIDPEELPQLTRLALEYTRVFNHTNGRLDDLRKLSSYKTQLMIDNDASASGAQIIALSTRDRKLAINSNVVPTSQKNRLYDLVAMDTVADPEFQKIKALADANLSWKDLQKAAKSANMVQLYGAGARTISLNVETKLADVLEKQGFQVITREELRDFNKLIDDKIKQAEFINAENVIAELKTLRKEINDSLENQVSLNSEIMRAARDVHPDAEEFVDKLNNSRLVGPQAFTQVANIMSKYLAQRAPVTENFIVFWKEVGETFVKETQKVDLPWVTFDDKKLYQRYRPKVQTSIQFYDPVSKRMVRNIYEDKAEDGKLTGKSSIASARIGLGVNGNHMSDASVVRQYHLWGKKNNIETATIHDAFMTNIVTAQKSKQALREIYANGAEADILRKTLKAMREEGLSKESYDRFIEKAKSMGLLDPENPLTKEEILQPIKPGFDFYGIGL